MEYGSVYILLNINMLVCKQIYKEKYLEIIYATSSHLNKTLIYIVIVVSVDTVG